MVSYFALMNLGEGKLYKAYEILKGNYQHANRYKFALVSFKMNRLKEAESALNPKRPGMHHADQKPSEMPNGAAGHFLLA